MLTRVLSLLATLALTAPLAAEEPKPAEQANYGNTPELLAPFRDFREPYKRFFLEPVPFRGADREGKHGDDGDTVPIGFMGPIGEAPDADLGRQMLEGVRLAFEEANAAGGYQGKPFELIVRPDLGLWGATSNEMAAFRFEDNALAVIGSIDGANTHIALRVALKTETVIVNTADTDPTLTETNLPWVVRCIADDRQQGYALAHHIFLDCGIDTVAAFRVNDRYGRVGIAEFRDAARRLRRPLRVEMRWDRGDRDFSAQLDRIAQTEVRAVVLWGNAKDCAAVVRAIRDRQMPLRIFGCDRLAGSTFLAEAGEAAEGVVAAATFDPTRPDPLYQSFVSAFENRFGHAPDAYAAHGYDGANILLDAVRQAGLNRIRIRDALYDVRRYRGVTGDVIFDATLNDVGPVYLAEVRNGRFEYREADFAKTARAGNGRPVHRTLAQSPPKARSPERFPKQHQGPYRVGCYLPLDADGTAVLNGIRMALTEDAARHPDGPEILLSVRDARNAWGENATGINDLVFDEEVLVLIGSTERRGAHLAEMVAAKFHFPVLALCGSDPTITQIPLPWVFNIAHGSSQIESAVALRYRNQRQPIADSNAALGYDAASLVVHLIRNGARTRLALRNQLAEIQSYQGVSGTFHFDALGNRVDSVALDGDRIPADAPQSRHRRDKFILVKDLKP